MKTKFHPIHAWTTCSVLIVALLAALFLLPHPEPLSNQNAAWTIRSREQVARNFGQLPLSFESQSGANLRKRVDFVARGGGGYTLFLAPTPGHAVFEKKPAIPQFCA